MFDRVRGPLSLLTLVVCLGGAAVFPARVSAQDHGLLGAHPPAGAKDPYEKTVSMSGANCCHGHDCARYYGEPRRTIRDGQQGWQFGKWFFRDDQLIAADSLAPEERGFRHVCIGVGYDATAGQMEIPRCAYIALGS